VLRLRPWISTSLSARFRSSRDVDVVDDCAEGFLDTPCAGVSGTAGAFQPLFRHYTRTPRAGPRSGDGLPGDRRHTAPASLKPISRKKTKPIFFGEQAVLCGGLSEAGGEAGFEKPLVEAGLSAELRPYFECLHEFS